MNKPTYLVVCVLFVWSCLGRTDQSGKDKIQEGSSNINQSDILLITENGLEDIKLPFLRKEMLPELRASLKSFNVSKELGEFEYGRAPIYTIRHNEEGIGFFEMDSEDTLKLNNLYLSNYVTDMYGLTIGDGYDKLKAVRGDSIKHYTDFHQHTYVIVESSNIMYEIFGEWPKNVDLTDLSFTEDQIKNWTIEQIIWREYPSGN